ncbi:MAG: hypothetical protein WC816_14675 [Sphingomonas sp.]|jgi:hypothetical protein
MQSIRISLISATIALTTCSEQPERTTSATVVNISPTQSKWNADEVLITAKSPDGLIGVQHVLTARLKCHVGDKVRASARGITLKLDADACTA